MKPILLIVTLTCLSSCVGEKEPELIDIEEITVETSTDLNKNETNNVTNVLKDSNFTTYFGGFEVTKIQMQVRNVIKSFDEYRAEIALGCAVFVASVFSVSLILSGVYLNRMKKNKKEMKNLDKKKSTIVFPRDTDMEVNAVLSIYRAKKIEIQSVNNGKATTHRYDEGTDDDEVIYEYAGKSKIIDFDVVNPVYFVDGNGHGDILQEKEKK